MIGQTSCVRYSLYYTSYDNMALNIAINITSDNIAVTNIPVAIDNSAVSDEAIGVLREHTAGDDKTKLNENQPHTFVEPYV